MFDAKWLLVTVATTSALLLAAPAPAQQRITVVSYGGAYTASQMLAFVNPYRDSTDVEVVVEDFTGGLAEIEAQVESLNVKWDVVDLELSDVVHGCAAGLLEEIDHSMLSAAPDGTPAGDDFLPGMLPECGVGQNVWSTVIAYDRAAFEGTEPTSIGDFFDLERFPGQRGLRKTPQVNLEWALLADGVPADQIYSVLSTPEGVDRAFAKLGTIKSSIVWWEVGARPPRMLVDGEVTLTSAFNGRVQTAIDKNDANIGIIWDGQVRAFELWAIPKGTRNLDAALDFVKFATAPRRLAEQPKHIAYGPARISAMAMLSDELRAKLPTAEANAANVLESNFQWWADNLDEMNQRFEAWLAQSGLADAPTLGSAR